MASKERIVDLVVRAKDQYSKVFADLKKQQANLAKKTNQVTAISGARKQIDDTRKGYADLSAQLGRYNAAIAQGRKYNSLADSELREIADAAALVRGRMRDSITALTAYRTALNNVSNVSKSGYLAFDRLALRMGQEATAANTASASLNKTAAATNNLTAAQKRQAAVANSVHGRKGENQSVERYGLKPYQMVNLGYQVNDVVSGLAMGQAPIQILAQQAGQFAQIWPKMMVGLVRAIPVLAALAGPMLLFAAAIIRVRTEANSLAYFNSQLALLADGGRFSAQELAKTAREISNLGMAIEDARKITLGFAKSGISNSEMLPLAQMAKDLTNLTGGDLSEAAARLGKAFQGSVKDVRELDKELQFLTADQLKQIYAMEQAGNKSGALALAQDALKTALIESRAESTDWSEAVDNLSGAWNRLVTAIANSGVIWLAAKGLDFLALSAEGSAGIIDAATHIFDEADNSLAAQYGRIRNQMDKIRQQIAAERAAIAPNRGALDPSAIPGDATKLNSLLATLARLEAEYAKIVAQIKKVPEVHKDIVTQSEEEKKLALDTSEIIRTQLDTMIDEANTAALTSRERFIENELLKTRNAALERAKELGLDFLGLTEEQTRLLREQAGMVFDRKASAELLSSGMSGLVDKIIAVESGGSRDPNTAKNPMSSATGMGQFLKETWLDMFRKYFPGEAALMGKNAILELRKDAAVSRQMIELYARENAAILQKAGVAVNDAALYLAHFLGPSGAVGILAAQPSTPVSDILGADQINANASILQGKNASEVIAWAQKQMGITQSELGVVTRLAELSAERLKNSKEYQDSYRQRIESQQFELSLASKAAREAAIAKAIHEEELTAQKAGLVLGEAQRAEIERTTGALFDRQNVELQVNQLMEQRSLLMESLTLAQAAGDSGKVASIVGEIQLTENAINAAINDAIAFWQAIGGPGADAAILKLQNLRDGVGDVVKDLETRFLPTAEAINEQLADIGANAFKSMAEAIANGTNVAQAFFDTLLQGIGEFLIEIGKAIIKTTLFNAISGGAKGGGVGGFISGWLGKVLKLHSGGIVGRSSGSGSRMVNPGVFAGAQRFHGGGVLGLGPNEVPIIGMKNEEMLTRDDPRHILNGGGAGNQTSIKNVNVFDPVDVLEASLATEAGEKVLINWMTRRARTISGALAV